METINLASPQSLKETALMMILRAKLLELNNAKSFEDIVSTNWYQTLCTLVLEPYSWESMKHPATKDEEGK